MSWRVFWAIVLIIMGVLFLLGNFGILPGNAWNYFFPVLLVLIGALLLIGWRGGTRTVEIVNDSAPLDGATRAAINLKHGAGRLQVSAGKDTALLFSGGFGGGVTKKISRTNGTAFVELKSPDAMWENMQFLNPRGLEWNVLLNPNVPTALKYEGGAAETKMDLSNIQLTELEINTGASSTDVVLPPPKGTMRVVVHSGAASVKLRVPPNIPATIRGTMGLGAIDADLTRFPDRGFGVRQSDNYAEAPDKIEMTVEGGVGSVEIR